MVREQWQGILSHPRLADCVVFCVMPVVFVLVVEGGRIPARKGLCTASAIETKWQKASPDVFINSSCLPVKLRILGSDPKVFTGQHNKRLLVAEKN